MPAVPRGKPSVRMKKRIKRLLGDKKKPKPRKKITIQNV